MAWPEWSGIDEHKEGLGQRCSWKSRTRLWQALKAGQMSKLLPPSGNETAQEVVQGRSDLQCSCSLVADKRTGTRPEPGSGRRSHYCLLSVGLPEELLRLGKKGPQSGCADAHGPLCLPAVLRGQVWHLQGRPPLKEWLKCHQAS